MTSRRNGRVLLRSPTEADLDEFIALTRRSRRFHSGWVAPPRDPEEFRQLLARNDGRDFEACLVVRSADNVVVGAVNISQIFYGGFQSAYLGYWIGAPFAGQGYMRDGLSGALAHAFGALRLHRVEANVQPGNIASRRLVQRLGFRLEGYSPKYLKIGGRWRDHERWALLCNEWRSR